jgi:hypothetical protein
MAKKKGQPRNRKDGSSRHQAPGQQGETGAWLRDYYTQSAKINAIAGGSVSTGTGLYPTVTTQNLGDYNLQWIAAGQGGLSNRLSIAWQTPPVEWKPTSKGQTVAGINLSDLPPAQRELIAAIERKLHSVSVRIDPIEDPRRHEADERALSGNSDAPPVSEPDVRKQAPAVAVDEPPHPEPATESAKHQGAEEKAQIAVPGTADADPTKASATNDAGQRRLFRPPGLWMDRFASFFFRRKTYETIFSPLIGEYQVEQYEAWANNRIWRSRWLAILYVIAFVRTVRVQLIGVEKLFAWLFGTPGIRQP